MGKYRINPYNLFHGSFVPDWVMRSRKIKPASKLVYARLLKFAGKNGACFPMVSTLSKEVGMSQRSVIRALAELRGANLIATTKTPSHLIFHFYWPLDVSEKDVKDLKRAEEELLKAGCPHPLSKMFLFRDISSKKRVEVATRALDESKQGSDEACEVPESQGSSAVSGDLELCQSDRAATPSWHSASSIDFKRVTEAESKRQRPPTPSAFDSEGEFSAPSPKRLTEYQQEQPSAPEDVETVDRLEAAKARETALRQRALKTKEKRQKENFRDFEKVQKIEVLKGTETTGPVNRTENGKNGQFPGCEISHTEQKASASPAEERQPKDALYRAPAELRGVWVREVEKLLPGAPVVPWRGTQEAAHFRTLVGLYQGAHLEMLFQYVLRNWKALQRRYFKGKGGPIPTLGVVVRFHHSWMPEAFVWNRCIQTHADYTEWKKASGGYIPPRDLKDRLLEVTRDWEALDLDPVA